MIAGDGAKTNRSGRRGGRVLRGDLPGPTASFPARNDEPCRFCGAQIAVGDLIGKVDGGMFGCARCVESPHVDALGVPTILAKREGPCRLCGRVVMPGDRLACLAHGQTACMTCGSDRELVRLRYFK